MSSGHGGGASRWAIKIIRHVKCSKRDLWTSLYGLVKPNTYSLTHEKNFVPVWSHMTAAQVFKRRLWKRGKQTNWAEHLLRTPVCKTNVCQQWRQRSLPPPSWSWRWGWPLTPCRWKWVCLLWICVTNRLLMSLPAQIMTFSARLGGIAFGPVNELQTRWGVLVVCIYCLLFQENGLSFSLEAVSRLQELAESRAMTGQQSPRLKASTYSLCADPMLPQEFLPLCKQRASQSSLLRLGKADRQCQRPSWVSEAWLSCVLSLPAAVPRDLCEICAFAACTGC